jgi:hypothetical protein
LEREEEREEGRKGREGREGRWVGTASQNGIDRD